MTEEIYIDGTLMDLDAGKTNVQLIYQSPVMTDFQSVVSNRTTNVTLPLTQNNLKAIGYVGTQADSDFPYTRHSVIYKRDGVQLLSGFATLLSIKANTISFCFTWGNVKAMEKLFNTPLRELTALGHCQYPPSAGDFDHNMPLIGFGGGRKGVGICSDAILQAIQNKCGVTGLTDLSYLYHTLFSGAKYVHALTGRNGDDVTKYQQRFKFGTDVVGELKSYGQFRYLLIGPNTSQMIDWHHYYDATSKTIFTNGAKKVRIRFNATMKYVYSGQDFPYPDGDPSHFVGLSVLKLTGLDIDHTTAGSNLVAASVDEQQGSGPYYMRYLLQGNGSSYYDVDVEGFSYIALCVLDYDNNYASQAAQFLPATASSTEISVEFDPGEGEEVLYGTGTPGYPICLNLPDMSCGQYIKNLLWLAGKFAYSQDGRTFKLISFNELESNKSKAVDWTDKMTSLRPAERQTKLDGTAQKNYFRYAEDEDYDNTQYQGMLPTEDVTIDEETEYCKSDFALCPSNNIPVWTVNDDSWDFAGDDVAPRLLLGNASYGTALILLTAQYDSRLKWDALLTRNYQQYAKIIRKPVVLKAEFVLTTYDLFSLDMTIPVYLKQTGHYYLIRKLTTKSGGVADAELIKL